MERFATGAWLDRSLLRIASWFSLSGTLAAIGYLLWTRAGLLDGWGRPLGTDFSNIWTAGRTALAGQAAASYDFAAHLAAEQAAFGPDVPFYSWHYPPSLLLVAAPLALLPYLAALALWQGATALAALAAVLRILPGRDTLLVALGFPAVLVCLTHGHTGFLTAALFAAGLTVLERRPVLSGICFGLLAYKPQLGLLVPLALAAGGHGRAIVAAAATVTIVIVASSLLFGLDAWTAFIAATGHTAAVVLDAGATGWPPIQTAFAAVRIWGGDAALAYAVQTAVAAPVAAAVAWVWWRRSAPALRSAALVLGCLLATPYVVDYDLVLLGPVLAWLVAHGRSSGFARWETSALALAWVAPLVGRAAMTHLSLPVGVLALAALFTLVIARAVREARDPYAGALPA